MRAQQVVEDIPAARRQRNLLRQLHVSSRAHIRLPQRVAARVQARGAHEPLAAPRHAGQQQTLRSEPRRRPHRSPAEGLAGRAAQRQSGSATATRSIPNRLSTKLDVLLENWAGSPLSAPSRLSWRMAAWILCAAATVRRRWRGYTRRSYRAATVVGGLAIRAAVPTSRTRGDALRPALGGPFRSGHPSCGAAGTG